MPGQLSAAAEQLMQVHQNGEHLPPSMANATHQDLHKYLGRDFEGVIFGGAWATECKRQPKQKFFLRP
jgi:hypothetical protein